MHAVGLKKHQSAINLAKNCSVTKRALCTRLCHFLAEGDGAGVEVLGNFDASKTLCVPPKEAPSDRHHGVDFQLIIQCE